MQQLVLLFVTVVLILILIRRSMIDDLLRSDCGPQVFVEAKKQQQFKVSWGYSLSQVCHENLGSAEQTLHSICCTEYVLFRSVLGVKSCRRKFLLALWLSKAAASFLTFATSTALSSESASSAFIRNLLASPTGTLLRKSHDIY